MHKRRRFRRGKVNRNPLRKIVDREPFAPAEDLWGREILECGHRVSPREDFIGQTNVVRRRCPFCARDQQTASEGRR